MHIADLEQQFQRGEAYLDVLVRIRRIVVDREARLQDLQAARSVYVAQIRKHREDLARLLPDNTQLHRELSNNAARIRWDWLDSVHCQLVLLSLQRKATAFLQGDTHVQADLPYCTGGCRRNLMSRMLPAVRLTKS